MKIKYVTNNNKFNYLFVKKFKNNTINSIK